MPILDKKTEEYNKIQRKVRIKIADLKNFIGFHKNRFEGENSDKRISEIKALDEALTQILKDLVIQLYGENQSISSKLP